jgi:GNAT superfamily N-acetyltransferase
MLMSTEPLSGYRPGDDLVMTNVIFQHRSGEQAVAIVEDITSTYIDAYSGNPDEDDKLFSRSSFISRTKNQARKRGFELVAATSGGALVGFSFGYPFAPGQWWADCAPPTREVLDASKFAVIELDVQQDFQRQGIGKRLLESLLSGRTEEFATLAATPGSAAHAMYIRWGWYKVGVFETPPVMDAMLIAMKS